MAWRLTLALGFAHPDFLLDTLTAQQWQDWLDFTSIEPIGDERDDVRAARSTADLAACWIGRTNVKDFLIDWYKGPQTPEEIEDAMRAAFGAPPRAR